MPFRRQARDSSLAVLVPATVLSVMFLYVSVWTGGKSHAIVNNKPWYCLFGRRLNTIPTMPDDRSRVSTEDMLEWTTLFLSSAQRFLLYEQ